MSQINFESILHNLPSDNMITTFQNISSNLLTETFPERKICVYSDDKPWYTEQLRHLKRQRLREYDVHGKSEKYLNLLETYKLKQKEAVLKYREKVRVEVLEGKEGARTQL